MDTPTPAGPNSDTAPLGDPRRTWRVCDDRRLPALDPLAHAVRRRTPVSRREVVWDSEDRVLEGVGIELTESAGAWSLDRGSGPVPLPPDHDHDDDGDGDGDADADDAVSPPRDQVEVFLRGRTLLPVLLRDTTTTLVTVAGKDGRPRAEVADVRVDEGTPDTAVLRSARWWALSDDGGHGVVARAVERALDDAAENAGDAPGSGDDLATAPRRLPPVGRTSTARRPRRGTAAAFAVAALDALRTDLVAVEPRVRADEDDAVHEFRKVLRRIRSVLAVHRGALDRDASGALRSALATVSRVAGVARDAEVLRDGLARSAALAPAGYVDPGASGFLDAHADDLRRAATADLRRTLRSARWFAALDSLDDLVDRAPVGPDGSMPVDRFVARRVERERRRLRRVVARTPDLVGRRGPETDELERLHDARKAARRLRYALEAVDAGVDIGERHLGRLQRVQDALGAGLDAARAAQAYRDVAELARSRGEDTFAFGVLATVEHTAAEHHLRRGRTLLDRL